MSTVLNDPNIESELREAYKRATGKHMSAQNDGHGEYDAVSGQLLEVGRRMCVRIIACEFFGHLSVFSLYFIF